jgi:uncharacterized phage protein gp47/JayE
MSFRRRDYPEVLDNLLTALVGGVSAEPHPYPPPGSGSPPRHLLDMPPARRLVSVFGESNGTAFRFRERADCELSPDGTALLWREGGARPDAGTLVHVNYLRQDVPATLTDLEIGGVARTIVEAMGRELARLYAQLEAVYDAAFLDSATRGALDRVVALLGLERVPAERPIATLRFERARGAPGAVTIPAGTRVIDENVEVEYETTATVTMSPAQTHITVAARDLEPANEPVPADTLTEVAMPIAGIVGVTNPAPAARPAQAETDAELRARARNFLHASEKATLGALRNALARQLVQGEISEPADQPGVVLISAVAEDLTPERREQLIAALEDTRPAGVRVKLAQVLAPARVDLELEIATRASLPEPERRAAHEAVRKAVEGYFRALPIREDARVNRIVGLVLAVPGVEDVTLRAARLREGTASIDVLDAAAGIIALADRPTVLADLGIADPSLPTRADLTIRFPVSVAAPDENAVAAALEAAFAYLAAAQGPRHISFGKLLRVLPPPVGQGETLAAHDAADPKPALPETAGDYAVTLFVHQASGLTRILAAPGDRHDLSPGERLLLDTLTIEAEG